MMRKSHSEDRRRHTKYVIIVCAVIVAIIVLVNIIAGVLENKYELTGDCSRTSVFSLSDETKQYIADLGEDIVIYGAYENGSRDNTIISILQAFDRMSDRISFELVDPVNSVTELAPFTMSGENITSGTVIVANKDKTKYKLLDYYDLYLLGESGIVGVTAQQSVISAIHYVETGKEGKILLVSGHNERDPQDLSDFLIFSMTRNLTPVQFEITADNMAKVASDTDVLLFAGPETDLTDEEYGLVLNFIQNGGKAIFYMDNAKSVDNGEGISLVKDERENFSKLFSEANLQLNNDIVLTTEDNAIFGSITVFRPTLVKSSLDLGATENDMFVGECASVGIIDQKLGNTSYVTASPAGCYSKELTESLSTLDQTSEDKTGTFPVSALGLLGKGEIYLAGSSTFITGEGMQYADNRTLALTLISDMLDDDGNPVIQPTLTESGSLNITSFSQQLFLTLLVIVVLPMLVLMAGFIVIKRRKMVK